MENEEVETTKKIWKLELHVDAIAPKEKKIRRHYIPVGELEYLNIPLETHPSIPYSVLLAVKTYKKVDSILLRAIPTEIKISTNGCITETPTRFNLPRQTWSISL